MDVHVGTCGWSFKDWKGPFYPSGTDDELAYYATQFDAVEIDSTWYRVPSPRMVNSWRERTPQGFLFCPKMPGILRQHSGVKAMADPIAFFFTRQSC